MRAREIDTHRRRDDQETSRTNRGLKTRRKTVNQTYSSPFDPPKSPRARGLLTLTYKGCIAYGTLLRKGFILRKGSQIVPFYDVPEGTIHFQDRVAYGHLVGPGSIVRENLIFPSSGMAGNFVAGRQMSSITKWKLNDGRSLKDLLP